MRPKSYDGIDFGTLSAELGDVVGFREMHRVRKGRLALLLIESRMMYDLIRRRESTISPTASAREIDRLLGSIYRIAEFARKAKENAAIGDALLRIIYAEQEITPGYPETTGRSQVSDFFNSAAKVYEFATIAQRAMASHERESSPLSAIAWLAGFRLPYVYGEIFRTRFTSTRGSNPGIDFVQSALKAIKVRQAISDETILSHFKAAAKVG
jgi:hypothetical protein